MFKKIKIFIISIAHSVLMSLITRYKIQRLSTIKENEEMPCKTYLTNFPKLHRNKEKLLK